MSTKDSKRQLRPDSFDRMVAELLDKHPRAVGMWILTLILIGALMNVLAICLLRILQLV